MQAILTITIPFFALVLCGYLAARRGLLPVDAVPGLNAYVLFFALPCMLFRFGASLPFAQLIDPVLMTIYALCALAIVAVTVALTWDRKADAPQTSASPRAGDLKSGAPGVNLRAAAFGVNLRNAAFGALVAAFPNTGFMGVPLLVALLGAPAAGPVIGTILVDLVLTSTLCIALAQSRRSSAAPQASDNSVAAAVARSLRAALTNPLPWSIALGAVAAATGFELPGPIATMVRLLADSATPVALFTIGAVLWRAGLHSHTHTPLRQVLPVALIKLLLHPLLVLGAGLAARALGMPVSDFGLTVLVLAAALPSASNVSLLTERYGADNGRVARIIMVSTALALVSFSLLAWWLDAGIGAAVN